MVGYYKSTVFFTEFINRFCECAIPFFMTSAEDSNFSFGDIGIIVAYTVAGTSAVAYLRAENDRLYSFNDGAGGAGYTGIDNGIAEAVIIRGKGNGFAFTAVKNNFLFKFFNSCKYCFFIGICCWLFNSSGLRLLRCA